jgi:hypothetical protein
MYSIQCWLHVWSTTYFVSRSYAVDFRLYRICLYFLHNSYMYPDVLATGSNIFHYQNEDSYKKTISAIDLLLAAIDNCYGRCYWLLFASCQFCYGPLFGSLFRDRFAKCMLFHCYFRS